MFNSFNELVELLKDIRALLYLAELRARSQHPGGTIDQYAQDVDVAIERTKARQGK